MAKLLVRGTGCSNAGTSGSVGALAGNRQGHPARCSEPFAPIAGGGGVLCAHAIGRFVVRWFSPTQIKAVAKGRRCWLSKT